MASNDSPAAAATAPSGEENRRLRTITIHILSPSLPAPNRFTINDLPIETTVGELRAHITQALPSQPAPSTQRLIYQGRPLLNNTQMLSEVLGTVEETEHSIHLVLPPPSASRPADNNGSVFDPVRRMRETSRVPSQLSPGSTALPQIAGDGLRFRGLPPPVAPHERQHYWDNLNGAPPGIVQYVPYGMDAPNPVAENHEIDGLRRQVENAEDALDHHFLPLHESLYQMRSHAEQWLQQRPHMRGHALHTHVHGLLQRILVIYRRVDRLTTTRGGDLAAAGPHSSPMQVFVATGPDGRQSLIMPSTSATLFPLATPMPQSSNIHITPIGNNNVNHAVPAGQNPAGVQDIVRQAVINQQRRQEVENVPAGQYLRRIWLFIRLYFCIYMISSSGSWARVFLVAGAVLIALLSDTEIPRRFQAMLVAPIQRHLEGLAHLGGPVDQEPQAAGGQNAATAQAGGNAPNTVHGELWSSIRRMERSIVLLLASLIPGIGERQVEVRNAAEAEAERLRQEEQQRLQQQQQQEEEAQADAQSDIVVDDTVENDAAIDYGVPEQPQPEQPQPEQGVPA